MVPGAGLPLGQTSLSRSGSRQNSIVDRARTLREHRTSAASAYYTGAWSVGAAPFPRYALSSFLSAVGFWQAGMSPVFFMLMMILTKIKKTRRDTKHDIVLNLIPRAFACLLSISKKARPAALGRNAGAA